MLYLDKFPALGISERVSLITIPPPKDVRILNINCRVFFFNLNFFSFKSRSCNLKGKLSFMLKNGKKKYLKRLRWPRICCTLLNSSSFKNCILGSAGFGKGHYCSYGKRYSTSALDLFLIIKVCFNFCAYLPK